MATINVIESDAMEQDNDSNKDYRKYTKIFPIKQLSPPLVLLLLIALQYMN